MENINLLNLLEYIDPAKCDYQEWVNVGMALKHEGYSWQDWDLWSKSDKRYHNGECEQKWKTFNGSAAPVTAGTIVQMAKDNGWKPPSSSRVFDWDDVISDEGDTSSIVAINEGIPLVEPSEWNPTKEIITYLETLFESTENVGYVTETWEKEEDGKVKYLPTKGHCDRTAGELIKALSQCNGDIGSVIGDYNSNAGAWIRFNPLDGKGIKNENVTDFRYALVESDNMTLEEQQAVMRDLELPIAVLVYSGGKSIHAIVKVDASSAEDYRKRVDYLYNVCRQNGLSLDKQNKNPSRLSRLPGVIRGDKKQFIIDTNIGKDNFNEWKEWIESLNDDLPDIESLEGVWGNLPDLSPSLIAGVLRQGHKMLVAGPSKAGKSFALIELCIAIAEGAKWLGFDCAQGKVMYVNLELDKASCLHRFKDVYEAMGIEPNNLEKIDIWNLRGRSAPMDKLTPKLIRRAMKKNYIAVIIDPIYKVITGDENNAEQMAKFGNQFDKICTELGCAVIYCHHHSKGDQGGKKSMDRASGSGVFARDPDAIIDIIELPLTEAMVEHQKSKVACKICAEWLTRFKKIDNASQDDLCSERAILEICHKELANKSYKLMMQDIDDAKKKIERKTAWRLECNVREFPKFPPVNLWFDHPIHIIDDNVLKDIDLNSKNSPYNSNFKKKKSNAERKNERKESLETAFSAVENEGKCSIKELSEYLAVTEKTIRTRLKEHGDFWIDEGQCGLK